jgi:D-3-phosphoglycerate dehydrogenase
MYKVLVSDKLHEKGVEILKNAENIDVDVKVGMTKEELKEVISQYHGIVIRSATKLTKDVLECATNLKAIGRAGIGVDNVDIPTATEKGIVVMNTPQGNTITTAEHTISMMMALSRNIPQATASLKSGKWEKSKFMGTELFNKTLGIVGLGNIGTIVANRALGLKMKVIGFDPYISEENAAKKGVKLVSLETLFKESDYITLHTPLTKTTKNLINKDTFKIMKNGVRIICCARGGIVNEDDLAEALESGKVAGAAFDVFSQEPPDFNHPLFKSDKFICTPHLGASTKEAQYNVAIAVSEQMVDFLNYGIIKNALNVPSVSSEELQILKPYIKLGEKMGSFITQMCKDSCGFTDIHIEYFGEVAKYDISPITLSVLKGLLTPIMGENVNFVNAPVAAKERGIKINESKNTEGKNFSSSIVVSTNTADGKQSIEGALFGKKDIRIVSINNFRVETEPTGHIILLYNYDRPGVIGNIGSFLGKNNINIGNMQFGRESIGGMAISIVQTDHEISREILEELKKLPNVVTATLIEL